MTTYQVILLLIYSLGMSLGQLLFKYASQSLLFSDVTSFSMGRFFQLGFNPYFLGAMLMYFGLSILWVWILSFTPLSRAYPFVAVAFVITPIMGHFIFMEALGVRFCFGLIFILIGLVLVSC